MISAASQPSGVESAPGSRLDALRAQVKLLESESDCDDGSWISHLSKWDGSVNVNNHKFHGTYLHDQLGTPVRPQMQAVNIRSADFQKSYSYAEASLKDSALTVLAEQQNRTTGGTPDYFLSHGSTTGLDVPKPVVVTKIITDPDLGIQPRHAMSRLRGQSSCHFVAQAPAAQDWNSSTVVCPQALKQNSFDSHAQHARHSRHHNKMLQHHTGPKRDVTALNEQLRSTKKQAAMQLDYLTAQTRVVQREMQQVLVLHGPDVAGPVEDDPVPPTVHAKTGLHVAFQPV